MYFLSFQVMAEQTDYNQLILWLFICGFFRGMALSNFTLTVSEYCSLEQLPAAFGWHMVGKGVFVTCFGPLIGENWSQIQWIIWKLIEWPYVAGLIRDKSGSYPLCIHSQTFCIALCCISWIIEFIIVRLRRTNSDDNEQTSTTATTNSTVTTPGNAK